MTASPRWEHRPKSAIAALAPLAGKGVALRLEDGTVDLVALAGARTGGLSLPAGTHDESQRKARPFAAKMTPCGSGWLAGVPGESSLVHHKEGRALRIAAGAEPTQAFGTTGEQIVVVRPSSVELWTLADQCRWRAGGGPWVSATIVGRVVVALRADGEMVFLSAVKGSVVGTLKLAGTETPSSWHLTTIDDKRLLLALDDWLVVVDAANQKVLRRTRVRGIVSALCASERRIVAGVVDGWIQTFDAFTSEPRGAVHAHEDRVVAVALDGTTIFSACREGPLRAWDGGALEAPRTNAPITSVAARGAFAGAGDRSGRVRLLKGVEEVGNIRLDGEIAGVAFGVDDAAIVAAGAVLVRLRKPWKTPEPILLRASASAFAADDAYAFTGTESGVVDVYDLDGGTHVTSYALTDAPITALWRLPGAHLVVGTSALDGRLFVIDVAEAKVVHRIEAHQDAFGVTCLAADPRGRIVASGSDDGCVAILDPAKGRVLARIHLPETPVSLAFEASGKKIAAVLANGTTHVIALDRKGELKKLEYANAARVAWGDALVIGHADGRLEILLRERARDALGLG